MVTIDLTMPIHIVNMLIMIVVMNAVLYKPIRSILQERGNKEAGLEKDIATFEKNTKLRIEEFERKLAEARAKAKDELDAMKTETSAAGSEKLAGIRQEADAEKTEQLTQIESEFGKAQSELKGQIDGFAGEMATKILGRAMS